MQILANICKTRCRATDIELPCHIVLYKL